ncbi:MAG: type II toxin-antitoxin system PemK/MazF family toxin [Bacilli bacterium]
METVQQTLKEKYRIEEKSEDRKQHLSPEQKAEFERQKADWYRRNDEYARFKEDHEIHYDLKKGEIYEIDWGVNVNAEFSNRHYGVVLENSAEYNPLVLVCPIKTNHNGINRKSDVDIGMIEGISINGRRSIAVINQIRSIDKMRIYTKSVINGMVYDIKEKPVIVLDNKKVEIIKYAFMNYLFGRF